MSRETGSLSPCAGGGREPVFPEERQPPEYIIDLLGRLAREQRENRTAGPCERMACPTRDQYASADWGAGANEARS